MKTPTMYFRFVERDVPADNDCAKVGRILQQFFEDPRGKDVAGDMFVKIYGDWCDVPVVKDHK